MTRAIRQRLWRKRLDGSTRGDGMLVSAFMASTFQFGPEHPVLDCGARLARLRCGCKIAMMGTRNGLDSRAWHGGMRRC